MIFLGLVVFGTVGFIADKKGMEIDKVVDAGPGLAFIVYPEAVSAMAVSPLFSFMFFFMLVLLAISRFTLISTLWIPYFLYSYTPSIHSRPQNIFSPKRLIY